MGLPIRLALMTLNLQLDLRGLERDLQSAFPDLKVLRPTMQSETLTVHLREPQPNPDDLRGTDVVVPLLPLATWRYEVQLEALNNHVRAALQHGLGQYQNHTYPVYRAS